MDRASFSVKSAKQINIKERDNFSTRNSMAAVNGLKGEVVLFGGLQSETGAFYNEIYTLDAECTQFKHAGYKDG